MKNTTSTKSYLSSLKYKAGVMVFAILLMMIPFMASAQPSQFHIAYGGTSVDKAVSIDNTEDGGFVVVGYTNSFGAGNYDVYMIKTDASGAVEFSRTFGGTNLDDASSVRQTADGGYIIVGRSRSYSGSDNKGLIIKTNSSGVVTWSKVFDMLGNTFFTVVRQTVDGGYIVGGQSDVSGQNKNIVIAKLNAAGTLLWAKTIGNAKAEFIHTLEITDDGGFAIVGDRRYYTAGSIEVFLIKADSVGTLQWTKSYTGALIDLGQSIIELQLTPASDRCYVIAGSTNSYGTGGYDGLVLKTDSVGNLIWSKTYGGSADDQFFKIAQKPNSGVLIAAGFTKSFGSGLEDAYMVTIDYATGNEINSRVYGGTADEKIGTGDGFQITPDGGLVMAGYTTSFGIGSHDFYIVKLDSLGNSGCYEQDSVSTVVTSPTLPTNTISPGVTTGALTSISHTLTQSGQTTLDSVACIYFPPLVVRDTVITNATCNNCTDGAINITIGGGTSPYQFLWSNGEVSEDISSLTFGVYFVTITDTLGDSLLEQYSVLAPGLTSWTGEASGDFFNDSNWTDSVPGINDPVIIGSADATGTLQISLSSEQTAEIGALELGTGLVEVTITAGAYDLDINGDLRIGKNGIVTATTNTINIKGSWANDGLFNEGTGTVVFDGATAQSIDNVSGQETFYNLTTTSAGTKTLLIDVVVDGTLSLTAGELAGGSSTITVTNAATTAVTSGTGFISNQAGGKLIRATNSTGTYLFPVGATGAVNRYTPIEIIPSTTSDHQYSVRMANTNPTSDGYSTTSKNERINSVNTNYYFEIDQIGGSYFTDIKLYYDEAVDGGFTGVAHWNDVTSEWENPIYSEPTNNTSPELSYVTIEDWTDYSTNAFALIKKKVEAKGNTVEETANVTGSIDLDLSGGGDPYITVFDSTLITEDAYYALIDSILVLDSLDTLFPSIDTSAILSYEDYLLTLTEQTSLGLDAGLYSALVIDTLNDTLSFIIPVGMEREYLAQSGLYLNRDNVTKTADDGWGNMELTSVNTLEENQDGWIHFSVPHINSLQVVGFREFGTTKVNGFEQMNFAFYLENDSIKIWENDSLTALIGTFDKEDEFRIERKGASIEYYKNNQLLKTTGVNPAQKLILDVAQYTKYSKIGAISIKFPKWGVFVSAITDLVCSTHETGSINISLVTGGSLGPFSFIWSNGATTQNISGLQAGVYTVTISPSIGGSLIKSYEVGYKVKWTDLQNATTLPDCPFGNTLRAAGYLAKAYSENILESTVSSGWMEFTVEDVVGTTPGYFVHVGFADKVSSIASKYWIAALRMYGTPPSFRGEAWDYNNSLTMSKGIKNGDVFRIEYSQSGVGAFYLNGQQFFSPTYTALGQDLKIFGSIMHGTHQIVNARASFGCSEPELDYAKLKKKLDGGFCNTKKGLLKFKYDEEYEVNSGKKLRYNIYSESRSLVGAVDVSGTQTVANSPLVDLVYGDNRYGLNLSPLLLNSGSYYMLEVINDKEEKKYLRFRFN